MDYPPVVAAPRPLSSVLQQCEDLRGPFGGLLKGRPVTATAERHEAPIGNVVRIAIDTLQATIRSYRQWIRRTGALMPGRSGGRARVYAGMRTFISVMPWIRFE